MYTYNLHAGLKEIKREFRFLGKWSILEGYEWTGKIKVSAEKIVSVKIKLEQYGYFSLFIDQKFVCEGTPLCIIIELNSILKTTQIHDVHYDIPRWFHEKFINSIESEYAILM